MGNSNNFCGILMKTEENFTIISNRQQKLDLITHYNQPTILMISQPFNNITFELNENDFNQFKETEIARTGEKEIFTKERLLEDLNKNNDRFEFNSFLERYSVCVDKKYKNELMSLLNSNNNSPYSAPSIKLKE